MLALGAARGRARLAALRQVPASARDGVAIALDRRKLIRKIRKAKRSDVMIRILPTLSNSLLDALSKPEFKWEHLKPSFNQEDWALVEPVGFSDNDASLGFRR